MRTFKKHYTLKDNRQLIIRFPELDDAQGLIEQMKRVDGETKFLAREVGEFSFTLEQEEAFIKGCLENDNRFFIVAEVEGKIVSNCCVERLTVSSRYLHRSSLGLAICKDYWNMGIGSKMIQACIDWAKDNQIEQIELEVVIDNTRAIPLYEKLGFEKYGTKKHAMRYPDGTYADEYIMVLFL